MASKEVFSVTTDPRTPSEVDEASDRSSIDSRNPFKDPKVAEYYRNLYDEAGYECRGAFDPDIEWTAAEEKSLVRRLDWHVCLWYVCEGTDTTDQNPPGGVSACRFKPDFSLSHYRVMLPVTESPKRFETQIDLSGRWLDTG